MSVFSVEMSDWEFRYRKRITVMSKRKTRIFSWNRKRQKSGAETSELRTGLEVCFPHYHKGEFSSLHKAVRFLKDRQSGWGYYMKKIVQYNVRYRDILREKGLVSLLHRLLEDAPELCSEKAALEEVRRWYVDEGKHLAGYDIQCYNIKDKITILGHEFSGLEDVKAHRSLCGRDSFYDPDMIHCTPAKESKDVFVAELYDRYPIFDSYDIGDDRTYQNYFFSNVPFSEETLAEMKAIKHKCNYCMVHEEIPEHLLPVLYYSGEGDYMILATKK